MRDRPGIACGDVVAARADRTLLEDDVDKVSASPFVGNACGRHGNGWRNEAADVEGPAKVLDRE